MKFSSYLKFFPVYLLSLLPFPVIYLLSDLGFVVLYYLVRYRRKVVRTNLLIAFPDKDEAFYLRVEREFYHQFCDVMLETSKSLTISKQGIKSHFKVSNPELIEKYFKEKRNIVMYAAHTGNWEWFATIPVQIPYQMLTLYQPLSNKYFDDLMKAIRSRFGTLCVESSKGYKTIMQLAAQDVLTLNLLAADQRPGNKSPTHTSLFFGMETAFLTGADRIARKGDQVVLFPRVSRVKRGYYSLEFIPITEKPDELQENEIIDQYAALLQESIEKSPALWLWSHNRWKNRPVMGSQKAEE